MPPSAFSLLTCRAFLTAATCRRRRSRWCWPPALQERSRPMPKMIFVNLPVADVEKSAAFYEAVGFTTDQRFSRPGSGSDELVRHDRLHAPHSRTLRRFHLQDDH